MISGKFLSWDKYTVLFLRLSHRITVPIRLEASGTGLDSPSGDIVNDFEWRG
jgi:hypothetical protein